MTPPRLTPTDLRVFRLFLARAHDRGRMTDTDYEHAQSVLAVAELRLPAQGGAS